MRDDHPMEVIRGPQHVAFAMEDPSRVGEARRFAAVLADRGGLDDVHAGRLALVVTELGTNLVRHATGGMLLLARYEDTGEVEVIAIDDGPGIDNVARSLSDGFSTRGTSGTGLGAVQRLSTDFHLHSTVPGGTVVVCRIRCSTATSRPNLAGFKVAGISVAAPGETVCGDAWAAAFEGGKAAVVVADGLGHGPDAAQASKAAVEVFSSNPLSAPRTLIGGVHARLRSTRGAAVTILQLDSDASEVRCSGAGNVIARLLSGSTDKTLLTQHGTAGIQIRTPDEATTAWPPFALLVVHSDGIESRWSADRLRPVLGLDPMIAAAILARTHSRGRDDATVVVVGREH